ncbi:MAG: hypothetical protein QOD99_1763 [Chthoniobacter sp.]|nr:hypothetical protein [Chthoniobacter sp.]
MHQPLQALHTLAVRGLQEILGRLISGPFAGRARVNPIAVTKTFLPPLESYVARLEELWSAGQITNNGRSVRELERHLCERFGIKHTFLIANGTLALQIAIKALDLRGEIITTPFSYVATTSSIVWENCTPVFADIDPVSLTIDPEKVETAMTSETTAILATHVYGRGCAVEALKKIADRHGIRIIYDGAHAFDVNRDGRSIFSYGDVSMTSLHATKLFHTVEGGALFTNDDEIAHKISYHRNFGHKGQEEFWGLGVNGKMSELHAAFGLCVLPHVPGLIEKRRAASAVYDRELGGCAPALRLVHTDAEHNFSYYPVLFSSEKLLLETCRALHEQSIQPRRYFYPALNTLNYLPHVPMPVSDEISRRVLCLPLSAELTPEQARTIAGIVKRSVSAA